MAGVAGPMAARDRYAAARFLSGLTAGELLGSVVVAVVIMAIGSSLAVAVPLAARIAVAGLVVIALGLADLGNRTPEMWRQVPQRLIHVLPPGRLGLAWGFDLGLLFTTKKTTSMSWAAVGVLLLVWPLPALYVVPGMAMAGVAAIVVRTGTFGLTDPRRWGNRRHLMTRFARAASGCTLLILGALTLARVI